jgi:hypothetical protein
MTSSEFYNWLKFNQGGMLMKKSLFVIWFNFIFFICLIIYGCATGPEITKLTDVRSFEKYSGGYLDKVMIVGNPRIDANRIQYENYITKALGKRKIVAIPSYTVIPEMKDLNRENIRQAAKVVGVKTVLVSKVVGIDEKNVIFQQHAAQRFVTTPRGTYMTTYIEPRRTEKFTKVRLETGLFEVESEKLIWGATSAIMNPESADEAIKDFSKAIIQQLVKDGYIR